MNQLNEVSNFSGKVLWTNVFKIIIFWAGEIAQYKPGKHKGLNSIPDQFSLCGYITNFICTKLLSITHTKITLMQFWTWVLSATLPTCNVYAAVYDKITVSGSLSRRWLGMWGWIMLVEQNIIKQKRVWVVASWSWEPHRTSERQLRCTQLCQRSSSAPLRCFWSWPAPCLVQVIEVLPCSSLEFPFDIHVNRDWLWKKSTTSEPEQQGSQLPNIFFLDDNHSLQHKIES